MAFFFLLFYSLPISALEQAWPRLLHFVQNRATIDDPQFYYSKQNINSQMELDALLAVRDQKILDQLICRYPARFLWIKNHYHRPDIHFGHCTGLQEFLTKAPAENISIVFASENIKNPMSMMGHVYIKLNGKNKEGVAVNHAISFFTDSADTNFIGLLWKALVVGKKGFYTLSPELTLRNNYFLSEQRNLWEYSLKLDKQQKKILQYHLYELKNISLDYRFITYNCSTLTFNILSVIYPEFQNESYLWITPLDVVRSLELNQDYDRVQVILADKWKMKAFVLEGIINSHDIDQITNYEEPIRIENREKNALNNNLRSSYLRTLFQDKNISKMQFIRYSKLVSENDNSIVVDFSNYKRPSLTHSKANVTFYYEKRADQSLFHLSILPMSHDLMDDNGEYLAETSMNSGLLDIAYNNDRQMLTIDQFTLYSFENDVPDDPLTHNYSTALYMGYKDSVGKNLSHYHSIYLNGGIGKTYRLHRDVDFSFFTLLRASYNHKTLFHTALRVQMLMREVYKMKSLILADFNYTHSGWQFFTNRYSWEQIVPFSRFALFMKWEYIRQLQDKETTGQIGLKKYF